jgi:NAD(P)-dependent dehydrogenase (short-subunit alcohol dehydrogenase family)
MRRTIAVTGSASGIGAAIRARLEAAGDRVMGIDRHDAEVIADLGTAVGRTAAIDAVRAAAGTGLDGAVACAGLGPHVEPPTAIVAVNYFAAVAILAGLRPALAGRASSAAVAVVSNAATVSPGADGDLAAACLAGDEARAAVLAESVPSWTVYAASKLALARWVRRQAPASDWAGAGIRLNAVAPGAVSTPLLAATLAHPVLGPAVRGLPIPLGGIGTPDPIAAAVAFLLGPDAASCCGSIFFVDGGSDAVVRPDHF